MLDPSTQDITTFSEEDGLLGDIFHYHAHQMTPSGALLFGGVNGFNLFRPEQIGIDRMPSQVRITGLYVEGVRLALEG